MSTEVYDSASARAGGTTTVLVVDSSPVFAEALTQLLQNRGLHAAEASFAQAGSAASALQPMLMLLDGDEPWRQVLACAAGVSTASPDTRVLLLVSSSGKWCEALAREAGALGCVSRSAGGDTLLEAIRFSRAGRPPPLRSHARGFSPPPRPSKVQLGGALRSLTPREHEILKALCGGLRDNAIAGELGISANTVRTHVQNLLGKLAVHSRHEAVTLALTAGVRPTSLDRLPMGHRQR